MVKLHKPPSKDIKMTLEPISILPPFTYHVNKNRGRVPISDYLVNLFIEILRFAQNDVSILVILKERHPHVCGAEESRWP